MRPYGEFLEGLKRATTFRRWRRVDHAPHGASPPRTRHVIRAGLRPRETASALRRFRMLAWPALLVVPSGLLIQSYYDGGGRVWAHVPAPFFYFLWTAISLVLATRAFAATDRLPIRLPATALNLLFPLWLVARNLL